MDFIVLLIKTQNTKNDNITHCYGKDILYLNNIWYDDLKYTNRYIFGLLISNTNNITNRNYLVFRVNKKEN